MIGEMEDRSQAYLSLMKLVSALQMDKSMDG